MALSPRKIRERESRKEEILAAAREVFLERGYKSTTMEEIAQKAGFSKGAIYFYFQSKEEILLHINCTFIESFLEALRLLSSGGDSPEKIVEILLENVKTIFQQFLSRIDILIYFTPGTEPLNVPKELEERWHRGVLGVLGIFQDLMHRYSSEEKREGADSLQYALFIMAMALGIFQMSKGRSDIIREKIDVATQFDIMGEVITKTFI